MTEKIVDQYITVYQPIAGWKAVHVVVIEDEFGRHPEPEQTAYFAHAKREDAVRDAKLWAESEGIRFQESGI